MTPEEFLHKHRSTIKATFLFNVRKFEIRPREAQEVKADLMGDLFFWASKQADLGQMSWQYVGQVCQSKIVDAWRKRGIIQAPRGKEPEISSISDFSEECLANSLASAVYYDRGGCSRFTENPLYGPFPGFEDLDEQDQTALAESSISAVDNSRWLSRRRLVNSILLKLGIDASKIHEYTTRDYSERDRRNARRVEGSE